MSNLKSYGGDIMIAVNKLRGIIAEQGMTQKEVAGQLGISQKTFYNKMKKGVFGTDEVEKMVGILSIDNPAEIFFANKVT